ncbi:MAG TPA: PTS sugar transporter subunit IIB [Longimicrobiales bacterium]|nr:PTS sugar transporter subunit IIB [Longimicrobiales bacterium]
MPIVLLRIDERLIHGQVVIGWGYHLRPTRYVVVDDELAASEWEQDLYRLGAGGAEVLFVTSRQARERLDEWRAAPERSILLTRDIATMRRLAEGGSLEGESVNIGGVHHGPDRDELLTYVHVSDAERQDLEAIAATGVDVSARDLPDALRVGLSSLLGSRWKSSK